MNIYKFMQNIKGKEKIIAIICTVPDKKYEKKIAETLLKKKISFCINAFLKVNSYFYWNKKIQKVKEIVLVIKTISSLEKKVVKEIKKIHNYQIPEILSIKIDKVSKKYFDWSLKNIKI
ncbi:divalent-cation tolerance protein CutA [bacterium endosymbiont of Pedicinus badii]|uniref:divalent-cation tolerance protein CutA n=1 Tax=bacterium endosymbiont of Pedicinus badii TaxID=1719126 RepID=UPI0009B94434|nr:divalent cation tolerance protein CutA [bacterium endosymbiont of Pedicinus badii]OQM34168.1 hypothetical protein AOQ89_02410 [bacterium endosymbiont of Pedicinus badii]